MNTPTKTGICLLIIFVFLSGCVNQDDQLHESFDEQEQFHEENYQAEDFIIASPGLVKRWDRGELRYTHFTANISVKQDSAQSIEDVGADMAYAGRTLAYLCMVDPEGETHPYQLTALNDAIKLSPDFPFNSTVLGFAYYNKDEIKNPYVNESLFREDCWSYIKMLADGESITGHENQYHLLSFETPSIPSSLKEDYISSRQKACEIMGSDVAAGKECRVTSREFENKTCTELFYEDGFTPFTEGNCCDYYKANNDGSLTNKLNCTE